MSTVSPSVTRMGWSRLAMRDSAARGAALRARADQRDPVGWESFEVFEVDDKTLGNVQVAEVSRDAHVADHRAAHEGDLAAVRLGGVEDLLDAVDMAGEAGDDHATRRRPEDGLDRGGEPHPPRW